VTGEARSLRRRDGSRDSGGGEAEGKKRAHQRTRREACLGLGLERGDLFFESGQPSGQLVFVVGDLAFVIVQRAGRLEELGFEIAGRQ
jgi:hypothetical protein